MADQQSNHSTPSVETKEIPIPTVGSPFPPPSDGSLPFFNGMPLVGDLYRHAEAAKDTVPDVMEIQEVAPHVITWFMTGPCLTITVTSNKGPSLKDTVIFTPQQETEQEANVA